MRAGGRVIDGKAFDRFGITRALGRDARNHGPDGSVDVTGNLLRTGLPFGTHDTHGWPTFAGWPVNDTNTHQQIYYRWLERVWMAGERVVVAQAVEDEPICRIEPERSHSCDEMDTIALEIRRLSALQRYVDAQSGGPGEGWLRIVEARSQRRRVVEQGKLAVVIGVESSDALGCSEPADCTRADVDRGLDRVPAPRRDAASSSPTGSTTASRAQRSRAGPRARSSTSSTRSRPATTSAPGRAPTRARARRSRR